MRRVWRSVLALLFPQRNACHACGAPLTSGNGLLCDACANTLRACAFTGGRAETVLGAEIACAASAYRYALTASSLVRALKFGSDQTAALPLAEGMAAVYAAMPTLREATVCIPVPVHYRRLRRRGYNQAQVLCEAFAAIVGLPVRSDALVRKHHKRSQIGKGREARLQNIAGAFGVGTAFAKPLRGASVLLVDDVLTTGATLEECAATLLNGGAESVSVLTACRTQ